MAQYNWQLDEWPQFTYEASMLQEPLYAYSQLMGRFEGSRQIVAKDESLQNQIDQMLIEAMKTSEIEGEFLSQEDIRSSLRNNLGLNIQPKTIKDLKSKGIAELMIACRENFDQALSQKMLHEWHRLIFTHKTNISKGKWRGKNEPMRIVSGRVGNEVIHFEAPPSSTVPSEMKQFIQWFNTSGMDKSFRKFQAPIRSGIAHLYFESIHPYEDGNGRMGRAIAEKALSQGWGQPVLLSLSKVIADNRNEYYAQLKNAQGSLDISAWLQYFLSVVIEAQKNALANIDFTISKGKFWNARRDELNKRQSKMLKRMFRDGENSFEGGINAKKYMRICKTSKATATRDLQDLQKKKILKAIGEGRARRYEVILET